MVLVYLMDCVISFLSIGTTWMAVRLWCLWWTAVIRPGCLRPRGPWRKFWVTSAYEVYLWWFWPTRRTCQTPWPSERWDASRKMQFMFWFRQQISAWHLSGSWFNIRNFALFLEVRGWPELYVQIWVKLCWSSMWIQASLFTFVEFQTT